MEIFAALIAKVYIYGYAPFLFLGLGAVLWKYLPSIAKSLWEIDWLKPFMKVKQESLLASSFFSEMERNVNFTIPRLNISHPFKSLVAKDFLVIKFRIFASKMKEFIQKNEFEKMDESMFKDLLVGKFYEALDSYEKYAKSEGIPSLFVEKFRVWHGPTTEQCL